VRSFKEILEGEHDEVPERAFLLKGTIEDVLEDVKGSGGKKDDSEKKEEEGDEEESSDESADSDAQETKAHEVQG
jgi:hypothetical protein